MELQYFAWILALEMGIRLKALVVANIHKLLDSLSRFKTKIGKEEVLSSVLADIQRSYLRLMTLLSKLEDPKVYSLEVIDTINEITRYKIGEFEFLHHTQYGMLSVDTGDSAINNNVLCSSKSHPPHEQVEVVCKMLKMYSGYREVNCDFCGEYVMMPGFATPIGRSVEEDFILAYHLSCREEGYEKYI